jgi:hypothetical protein
VADYGPKDDFMLVTVNGGSSENQEDINTFNKIKHLETIKKDVEKLRESVKNYKNKEYDINHKKILEVLDILIKLLSIKEFKNANE